MLLSLAPPPGRSIGHTTLDENVRTVSIFKRRAKRSLHLRAERYRAGMAGGEGGVGGVRWSVWGGIEGRGGFEGRGGRAWERC